MSRRARTRAPVRAAKELSFLPAIDDTELLDEPAAEDHDGWSNVRERDPLSEPIDQQKQWPFPGRDLGY